MVFTQLLYWAVFSNNRTLMCYLINIILLFLQIQNNENFMLILYVT